MGENRRSVDAGADGKRVTRSSPNRASGVLPTSADWRDSVESAIEQASPFVLGIFLPGVFLSNCDQRPEEQFHPGGMEHRIFPKRSSF
jgi:hypothetical protein